jgi:nucleoid DNA-binding protein
MTKSDLIDLLAEERNVNLKVSESIINAILNTMADGYDQW